MQTLDPHGPPRRKARTRPDLVTLARLLYGAAGFATIGLMLIL